MKHLQIYEMTTQEHKSMKDQPFRLILPASPHPQEVTLTVAGRRNGASLAMPAGPDTGAKCPTCKRSKSLHGVPFTAQTLASHRFRMHGKRANKKAGAK